MSSSRIYGPLISAHSVGDHVPLLTEVFGMRVESGARLPADATAALFATECTTEVVVLRTPGVEAGAVLCRFESELPEAAETIRDGRTRLYRDAFRVIDFYARDFETSLAHARDAGFPMIGKEASYETGDGGFREAHHLGADHVVTAFLHGPADFFTDFAEVRDRVSSEPVSISLPLSDAGPTLAWYERVFGWGVVYEYDFVDASFSELVGVDAELRVRSRTVGPSRRQTYVNIVDYGHAAQGGSLLGCSVAPRRGLLGLVVLTDELDALHARAGDGAQVVTLDLAPFGVVRACVLIPPFSAPHLVVERG
ncbi:hypothetical protein [Nocardioides campestrisoli]|uniref:hypothetical protein n=1 Tax=Nocardioides campestrisoli TaxID=2736757 RepID=UPI0015E696AA|nr:hypothetical protein [Nocardioides campestrisoli]